MLSYDTSGVLKLREGAYFECCVYMLQQTNAADSPFKDKIKNISCYKNKTYKNVKKCIPWYTEEQLKYIMSVSPCLEREKGRWSWGLLQGSIIQSDGSRQKNKQTQKQMPVSLRGANRHNKPATERTPVPGQGAMKWMKDVVHDG